MVNPDVFCRDIAIIVKIFLPYNTLKGNDSKQLTGLDIFLSAYVQVGNSSKFHSPGRIVPNILKFKIIK
jgi:hypothetical protein